VTTATASERRSPAGDLEAVRSSPLLQRLPHETQVEVLSLGRPTQSRRSETLLRSDDDLAVLLLAGTAVSGVVGQDGSSAVTGVLGPGSVAGLPVVLGQPAAGVAVVALTPTEALVFRGSVLRDYLADHPAFAVACLRTISEELASAREDLARQAGTSTTERVVDRLLELADRWGRPVGGEVHIPVPLTQEMLASWARASRESTARALHGLRANGLLRTGRREFAILDIQRLEARRKQPSTASGEVLRALLDVYG
jgi:CRP/FNR family transcriptional regulator, cyclic AMP receptor protein